MFIKQLLLTIPVISLLAFNVQAAEPTKSMTTTEKAKASTQVKQSAKSEQTKKTTATATKKAAEKTTATTAKKAAEKTTATATKKVATEKTEPKKATATQKKTAPVATLQGLEAFNKSVGITLVQRATAVQDNQPVAVLVYEVKNKGKNSIKSLHWASAFTVNNQIFFVQEEIQPQFEKALGENQTETITITLLLDKLPENIRNVFASTEAPIGHITVAKQITFADGTRIEVKE